MVDGFMSAANHRLTEIMEGVMIIATIVIPRTFLVGFSGLNFHVSEG